MSEKNNCSTEIEKKLDIILTKISSIENRLDKLEEEHKKTESKASRALADSWGGRIIGGPTL